MAHILVVEDVEDIRLAYQLLLENGGHEVALACNARHAISVLDDKSFDLILTDLIMPDGDGFELANHVHQWKDAPKIIMVSGGGDKLSRPQALEMANVIFDAVLSKPVTGKELLRKVEELLCDV